MKAVLLALAIAFPGAAGAHDWYTGLTQNGSDCCSGHDCGEVPSDRVACRYGLCWITLKPRDHLMTPVGDTPLHPQAGFFARRRDTRLAFTTASRPAFSWAGSHRAAKQTTFCDTFLTGAYLLYPDRLIG